MVDLDIPLIFILFFTFSSIWVIFFIIKLLFALRNPLKRSFFKEYDLLKIGDILIIRYWHSE